MHDDWDFPTEELGRIALPMDLCGPVVLSREARGMFGFPASPDSPVTTDQILERIAAGDRDRVRAALKAAVAEPQAFHTDFLVEGPGIEPRHLRAIARPMLDRRGAHLRLAGTLIDVTELKQIEIALEQREARLRSILETAPEAIITINEMGIIESFSNSAEALFGYAADEVTGRNISMLMPSPYAEEHDSYLARYRRTGERRIIGIGRVVDAKRKDGSVFPIELAVGEVATGTERTFTGFIRDLTARQRMEQELRQAQRMEAIGQLTGGVAHDFNNLLTVIMGNLEMALDRIDPDQGRMAGWLNEAYEAASSGAELTQRLLAFGRRQPLEPRVTDLSALVTNATELLRRTLGESIEMRTVVKVGTSRALVDPNQLQNALINVAINARDAMPDGGRLTIELDEALIDSQYADLQFQLPAGRYAVIAVTDTGTGMTPEVRDRAFEPFFTTKDTGSGTGLGLSMVYGFVKQTGGHVQIYSEPGRGTTIRMYLPQAKGNEQADALAPDATIESYAGEGERILVVEDDPRVRRVTAERLRELGYQVVEAEDGPSALERLASIPDIDLLLSDMVMPGGMNGVDLAEAARAAKPAIRVLLTSGYAEPDLHYRGMHDDKRWLRKPHSALELARTVRTVLAS